MGKRLKHINREQEEDFLLWRICDFIVEETVDCNCPTTHSNLLGGEALAAFIIKIDRHFQVRHMNIL